MNRPIIDLSGAKILTVDDVPANLDVLSQSLESDGYNVLVATSGEAAIQVAQQTSPDLILLDVMMPGIDGFETCRRLKADPETAAAPVIFLTARNELEGVLEGFQAGGVDYISKPFQKEEVLIRIRTHLERDRLARDLADLNAHLEQKVEERTAELQQKVRELEGRDRIAQHLLTYHSLDETLTLVLEVCSEIAGVSTGCIHLKAEESFVVRAAIQEGQPVSTQDLGRAPISTSEMSERIKDTSPVRTDDGKIWIPIPGNSGIETLGAIEVEGSEEVADEALEALASFALQTAVAITDAQVHENAGKWKDQLDEILKMDEVVDTIEHMDQLVDEREADQS
jgi:DNA-binding response OmpR family regulator